MLDSLLIIARVTVSFDERFESAVYERARLTAAKKREGFVTRQRTRSHLRRLAGGPQRDPVQSDQFDWSHLPIVLIFAFIYLSSMWGGSHGRDRRKYVARKRELEAVLKELDD